MKLSYVFVALAALLVVGCGQAPRSAQSRDRAAVLKSLAFSNIDESLAEWRCPSSTNVNLDDYVAPGGGYDYSGKYDYKVCVSRDAVNRFRVIPKSGMSGAICIYPLTSSTSGSVTLADNPRCFTIGSQPIEVEFENNNINYMAIVDINYTDQMNACLSGPSPCPAHSEGFVQ